MRREGEVRRGEGEREGGRERGGKEGMGEVYRDITSMYILLLLLLINT